MPVKARPELALAIRHLSWRPQTPSSEAEGRVVSVGAGSVAGQAAMKSRIWSALGRLSSNSTWFDRRPVREELFSSERLEEHARSFIGPDEGALRSYQEIERVFEKCGFPNNGRIFHGSPGYLTSLETPIDSPAATFIVERARAEPERPLYVCAMGALTNIASALLMAPDIVRNIVVVWTSGFPSYAPLSNRPSLNLVQDHLASQLLFDCGAPIVYLPGFSCRGSTEDISP
jgi:hypothetical protein